MRIDKITINYGDIPLEVSHYNDDILVLRRGKIVLEINSDEMRDLVAIARFSGMEL